MVYICMACYFKSPFLQEIFIFVDQLLLPSFVCYVHVLYNYVSLFITDEMFQIIINNYHSFPLLSNGAIHSLFTHWSFLLFHSYNQLYFS